MNSIAVDEQNSQILIEETCHSLGAKLRSCQSRILTALPSTATDGVGEELTALIHEIIECNDRMMTQMRRKDSRNDQDEMFAHIDSLEDSRNALVSEIEGLKGMLTHDKLTIEELEASLFKEQEASLDMEAEIIRLRNEVELLESFVYENKETIESLTTKNKALWEALEKAENEALNTTQVAEVERPPLKDASSQTEQEERDELTELLVVSPVIESSTAQPNMSLISNDRRLVNSQSETMQSLGDIIVTDSPETARAFLFGSAVSKPSKSQHRQVKLTSKQASSPSSGGRKKTMTGWNFLFGNPSKQ